MNKIKNLLLSIIGRCCIQLIFFLNKVVIHGEENFNELIKSEKPIMVCVWHGRLLFTSWYLRYRIPKLYAIASKHSDAEIISKILKKWGYKLIRGSSTRGGRAVIEKMNQILKENSIIAITNDGPKGPPFIAKEGSISVAISNNVNIVTITGTATKFWKINSWDQFIFPKPFGTIKIIISPPFKYDSDKCILKEETKKITNYMNKYQNKIDKLNQKII